LLWFSFVPIPLNVEEVVIWFCGYPSCEEVIVIIFLALCLAFYVEVVVLEERSCILQVCICQILDGGFLCGRSCVDT